MDAAAQLPASGPGLLRLLEHCECVGRLTEHDPRTAFGRLEAVLGRELTDRLLGALMRRDGRAVLPF
jgi:hypothetical protein